MRVELNTGEIFEDVLIAERHSEGVYLLHDGGNEEIIKDAYIDRTVDSQA